MSSTRKVAQISSEANAWLVAECDKRCVSRNDLLNEIYDHGAANFSDVVIDTKFCGTIATTTPIRNPDTLAKIEPLAKSGKLHSVLDQWIRRYARLHNANLAEADDSPQSSGEKFVEASTVSTDAAESATELDRLRELVAELQARPPEIMEREVEVEREVQVEVFVKDPVLLAELDRLRKLVDAAEDEEAEIIVQTVKVADPVVIAENLKLKQQIEANQQQLLEMQRECHDLQNEVDRLQSLPPVIEVKDRVRVQTVEKLVEVGDVELMSRVGRLQQSLVRLETERDQAIVVREQWKDGYNGLVRKLEVEREERRGLEQQLHDCKSQCAANKFLWSHVACKQY